MTLHSDRRTLYGTMYVLALRLALAATSHHLAVAPATPDDPIGEVELAVRDALRAALPGDTIQTQADVREEVLSSITLADVTEAQAKVVCDLACTFGKDGMVTARRVEFAGRVLLKVAFYKIGNPVPVAEVSVPMEQTQRSAAAAVKELLAKL